MTRLFLVACTTLLLTASTASAQHSFDSYVSSTGDDGAHFCTRPTPCATFTRAFELLLATGTIHVVDQGAYGPLTITHGVTIDGGGFATTLFGGGFDFSTYGPQFVINAPSAVVTIENFTLSGSGVSTSAISVSSVGALHVQNCVFNAFTTRAIDFRATGGYLTMKNVTITDMPSGTGVYVANSRAALENIAVHNAQTAVIAAGSSTVSIVRGTANGNGTAFAAAYGSTAQLNIDECMMSNNQWAIVVGQGATAYVGRSSLFNNYIKALYNDGTSFIVSYGTNQFAGNASDGSFTSGLAVK